MQDRQDGATLFACLERADGRERWREHRDRRGDEEITLTGVDLTSCSLRGYDLSDLNLCKARLTRADLTGADFADAWLCYADLRGARLDRAHLVQADLRQAVLNGARLRDADLRGACLKGANLASADLTGAGLTDADLTGANLRGACLRYARLAGCGLMGANLAEANVTGALVDDAAPRTARNWLLAQTDRRTYLPWTPPSLERVVFEPPVATGLAALGFPDRPTPRLRILRDGAFELPVWEVEPDLHTRAGCCLVLGVAHDAPPEEIVRAFRRKAKLYHPDMVRNRGETMQRLAADEFRRLHQAYEWLTRPTTRSLADAPILWPPGLLRRASPTAYSCEEYELLARANPRSPNVFYNLGWKYFEAGRHADAIAAFTRVLELDSDDADALTNLRICRICLELQRAEMFGGGADTA